MQWDEILIQNANILNKVSSTNSYSYYNNYCDINNWNLHLYTTGRLSIQLYCPYNRLFVAKAAPITAPEPGPLICQATSSH